MIVDIHFDNVYCYIKVDSSQDSQPVIDVVKDSVRYHPRGYKFSKAFKEGRWDGYKFALERDKNYPGRFLLHVFIFALAILAIVIALQQRKHKNVILENQNRLNAMSKSSFDAQIMIDSFDSICFWNLAAENMFGFTEKEMIGKKLHDIIVPANQRGKARQGMVTFSQTGQGPILQNVREVQAQRKSGETFPAEIAISSFRFKGLWFAVGGVRDITLRKRYEKKLMVLATTDSLTGLFNRGHFMKLFEMQYRVAKRYKKEFCLLMFDIDKFKRVNDQYGHDSGDIVLKSVASTVKKVLRETDIIGRVGGEEFAVIMPETSLETAINASERLRMEILRTKIILEDTKITCTVSIGVTSFSMHDLSIGKMMKKADILLYKAKQTGRNRVMFA